jgi:hypothetical protein
MKVEVMVAVVEVVMVARRRPPTVRETAPMTGRTL